MAAESGGGFRSFWSGSISFGLVSVPVALLPANRPRSVSLRMIDEEGTPLQRRYVCSKDGEELDWDDITRGYEIEKGRFVEVTEEELEAVEPRKTREIDLRLFVDRDQIRPVYFERAYFLTPAGGSNKAYRLLAEVMERSGRAGIATFVMRAKEYLVAILAENGILRAETLRFHDEIRMPEDVGLPEVKKPKADMAKKFEREIGKLKGKLDVDELMDDSAERLLDLVEKKRKKGTDVITSEVQQAESEDGGEVIDLMAVLRQSLGGAVSERKPAKRAGKKAARKPSASGSKSRKADDLSARTKNELMEQARELDIPGRSSMSKAQLVQAIRRSA